MNSVRVGDERDFFRNQSLGKNTCMNIVKSVCSKLGIRSKVEYSYMTTHGLEP